jgi:arylsulfatase A-like enzyme/Flp pilus assembly protein TadD
MAKKKKSRRRKKKQPQGTSSPTIKKKAAAPKIKEEPRERRKSLPPVLWIAAAAVVILAVVLIFGVFRSGPQTGAGAPVTPDGGLSVVLITLDTTRADRIGSYGYAGAKTPNLDFLADSGVRFAEAACPVPLTLPSHCSILTGTYPLDHRVHNNGSYTLAEDQNTLAERLRAEGLNTAAFVASFSVDSRFGLDQGFEIYDDNFMEGSPFKALNSERKAEPVYRAFARWLDSVGEKRFFSWIHFFDPHLPYDPPSPYKEEFAANPYDGEIAYMDSFVGEVVGRLEEKGLLERTLIVVAGDHGEGLGDKFEAGHGIFLYDPTVKVPLIFYARNHLPRGRVISNRVRLVDIRPTILEILALEEKENIRGRSLVPMMEGRDEEDLDAYIESFYPRENFGWSELTGLLSGPWKYIHAPKPELYNLDEDPGESVNRFKDRPRVSADMNRKLDALIKSAVGGAGGGRELSAEEQERLRSLGYIRYSDGNTEGDAPDPKDKTDELRKIQTAEMHEFAGDFASAAEIHREMLDLRPKSASSYVNLALAQARMKDFDAAIATLKKGVEAVPDSEILLSRLGHTYFVTGRQNEAFEAMQQVLTVNPRYLDALTACAIISDGRGNKAEAGDYFERALEVEPENKFLRMSYALNLATGGKIPEAVSAYTGLISDYPDEASNYQFLGITYGLAGNYEDAITNLKKAVGLKPTPIAYLNLAVALKGTGDIAGAIRNFELYLENPEGEDEAKISSVRAETENLKRRLNR